jgi:hypothetical protein
MELLGAPLNCSLAASLAFGFGHPVTINMGRLLWGCRLTHNGCMPQSSGRRQAARLAVATGGRMRQRHSRLLVDRWCLANQKWNGVGWVLHVFSSSPAGQQHHDGVRHRLRSRHASANLAPARRHQDLVQLRRNEPPQPLTVTEFPPSPPTMLSLQAARSLAGAVRTWAPQVDGAASCSLGGFSETSVLSRSAYSSRSSSSKDADVHSTTVLCVRKDGQASGWAKQSVHYATGFMRSMVPTRAGRHRQCAAAHPAAAGRRQHQPRCCAACLHLCRWCWWRMVK